MYLTIFLPNLLRNMNFSAIELYQAFPKIALSSLKVPKNFNSFYVTRYIKILPSC